MPQEVLLDPSDLLTPPPLPPPLPPFPRRVNQPLPYLLDVRNRDKYLEIGLPLYRASIKCDWKAAKAILDKNTDIKLHRYSITENGETALHIAASAKAPCSKKVVGFVTNLVTKMENRELELVNNNKSTALYLAAAAGNVKTVEIMMERHPTLDRIPGGGGDMMPLYAAVLFGNKDVARYLYVCSKDLVDDRWTDQRRTSLVEKCVESDMFDIAIQIVKKYPELGRRSSNLLVLLARKPEAFREKKSSNTECNIIKRTIKSAIQIVKKCPYRGRSINLLGLLARKPEPFHEKKSSNTGSNEAFHEKKSSNTESNEAFHEKKSPNTESNMIRRTVKSVSAFIGYKAGTTVKKGDALPLLRILWERIGKLPRKDMDDILRGPPDSIESGIGRIHQTMQLKALLFYRLDKLDKEAKEITMKDTVREQEREDVIFQKLKVLVSNYVVDVHLDTRRLIKKENTTDEDQALELQQLISEYIVKLHDETKNMPAFRSVYENRRRLLNLISDHIKKMRDETEIIDTRYSSRVMFIAAEVGNTNFLLELIRRQPDLIWKVDDNGLSIFHIAVKHRHEGIYNLLYEIGSMKDMVTPLRDKDGNNMLHLAAMRTRKKNLEEVSGAALQMQRELLWFKEVERMIPPYLRESKNKDGFTPHELFTMEHQCLIDQGEKWMKSTAKDCMVVATLIATIVFAAAFTVPGGYNQNDGIPMFKRKLSFVAFVVADAISLFLSSASILTFLSILTSRYAERDFVASLPMKLMLGLVTLFLSIGTMMVTFSVSFFVLYLREMKWIPIFISGFAVIPAILYVVLQFHLLVDVVRSTYGGKYLFKPTRQVLFYENPKF